MPTDSGIYLFKDARDKIIYVGKALNLRKRVLSYFTQKTHREPKVDAIMVQAKDIDCVITSSEMEALVIESNLVKKYRPRYNTRLKDDKAYPYLKITVKDKYPKVVFTRKLINDGARYYGPLSSSSVKAALYALRNTFRLCGCKLDLNKKYARACLDYQIKRCMGPCIDAVTETEYRRVVKDAILFLEGKSDEVLERLKEDMVKASEKLDFEQAAFIRDQIKHIEKFIVDQKVVPGGLQDEDFIALSRKGGHAVASIFMIRGGKIAGRENFVLLAPHDDPDNEVLAGFFRQYYNMNQSVPGRISIPLEFDDKAIHREWLREKRGKRVSISVPDRGERKRLLELATQNASLHLNDQLTKDETRDKVIKTALNEIKCSLDLKDYPRRIECYDISNLGRDNINKTAVASCVVFIDGHPAKDYYRRFRIKTVDRQDDYSMMEEVLARRLKSYDPETSDADEKINLLIVDGGKGHLGVARRVAQNLGLMDFDIAALAKQDEELFTSDSNRPINLPKGSPELFLIQKIRDEAHRFAVEYQRRLRSKYLKMSVIDDIPGLGPKRKTELFKMFKSIERIRKLSIDELMEIPGITSDIANAIINKLNRDDK